MRPDFVDYSYMGKIKIKIYAHAHSPELICLGCTHWLLSTFDFIWLLFGFWVHMNCNAACLIYVFLLMILIGLNFCIYAREPALLKNLSSLFKKFGFVFCWKRSINLP